MCELTEIYRGEWQSHEEWGAIRIMEDSSGELFTQECGYCVMSDESDTTDWGDLDAISYEKALELIDEWDEIEEESETWY